MKKQIYKKVLYRSIILKLKLEQTSKIYFSRNNSSE